MEWCLKSFAAFGTKLAVDQRIQYIAVPTRKTNGLVETSKLNLLAQLKVIFVLNLLSRIWVSKQTT